MDNPDTTFMADEQKARKALEVASFNLSQAYADLMRRQNGLDVAALSQQVHLMIPQLDTLVQLLVDKGLISRAEFWNAVTSAFEHAEGGVRKTIRELPSIIQGVNGPLKS